MCKTVRARKGEWLYWEVDGKRCILSDNFSVYQIPEGSEWYLLLEDNNILALCPYN